MWRKRSAQDWYSVAAQIPLAQPKKPVSFHDGAQMSTAMRNEGKTNYEALQSSVGSQVGLF